MRPLRYSINVTLDGCCDHRAIVPDEELHRHAGENIERADALLFGRVIYEMMEAAWRPVAETGAKPEWMADWMVPFAWRILFGSYSIATAPEANSSRFTSFK